MLIIAKTRNRRIRNDLNQMNHEIFESVSVLNATFLVTILETFGDSDLQSKEISKYSLFRKTCSQVHISE